MKFTEANKTLKESICFTYECIAPNAVHWLWPIAKIFSLLYKLSENRFTSFFRASCRKLFGKMSKRCNPKQCLVTVDSGCSSFGRPTVCI